MATRKYLKFGLRADKNLADLTDSTTALGNCLNDLTSVNDIDGTPTGFTVSDLGPLFVVADSDIDETFDYTRPAVPPYAFTRLKGTRAQATVIDSLGRQSTKVIEPQLRIQDYLDKYKTVFGDPPFINGGSGPIADFIPTDRINSSTQQVGSVVSGDDIVSGNVYRLIQIGSLNANSAAWDSLGVPTPVPLEDSSGTVINATTSSVFTALQAGSASFPGALFMNISVQTGSYESPEANIAPSNLSPTKLYTKIIDNNTTNIYVDDSYWNSTGRFVINGRLFDNFPNANGILQFTGYQDGSFAPTISTNGLFLLEQDITANESTEDNWETIRGGLSESFIPFYPFSYETEQNAGITRITFDSNGKDIIKLATGMSVTITDGAEELTGNVSTVSIGGNYVDLDLDLAVDSSGTTYSRQLLVISSELGGEEVSFSSMGIAPVGFSQRRRVRYTYYWPENTSNINAKAAGDVSTSSFGFENFYPINSNQSFDSKKYSYPYYREKRASPLNELADHELKVTTTLKDRYIPKSLSSNITPPLLYNSTGPEMVETEVSFNNLGRCTVSSGDARYNAFLSIQVGDIVTIYNTDNSSYIAFKIETLEIDNNNTSPADDNITFTIDPTFSLSFLDVDTSYKAIILRNEGIAGIYKYVNDGGDNRANIITSGGVGGSISYFVNEIFEDDLVYKIEFTGGAGNSDVNQSGFRVTSVDHNNTPGTLNADFTVQANPNYSETFDNSTTGLLAVYRSKGLIEKSTVSECYGVIGKEATAQVNAGNNTIDVTDVTGISVGDFVYFDGVIPHGSTVANKINTPSQKAISLNGSNVTSAVLLKGSTIVFVDHTVDSTGDGNADGWEGLNKEYCIIPLNTAPPWAGTPVGLKTPDANPNVVAKELRFSRLSFTLPTTNITETVPTSTRTYLNMTYTDPDG